MMFDLDNVRVGGRTLCQTHESKKRMRHEGIELVLVGERFQK